MTISIVQSTTGKGTSTGSSLSLSGVSSSNVLVLIVASQYQPTTPSGFTLAYQPPTGSGSWGATSSAGLSVYINSATAGGSVSVPVSFSSSSRWNACLIEVTGIGGTVDAAVTNAVNGNSSGQGVYIPSSSGSFAQATEICFAATTYYVSPGSSSAGISNPPSDPFSLGAWTGLYVDQNSASDLPIEIAYRVLTSTSKLFPDWTWSDVATNCVSLGISIKSGSGSGGGSGGSTLPVNSLNLMGVGI